MSRWEEFFSQVRRGVTAIQPEILHKSRKGGPDCASETAFSNWMPDARLGVTRQARSKPAFITGFISKVVGVSEWSVTTNTEFACTENGTETMDSYSSAVDAMLWS